MSLITKKDIEELAKSHDAFCISIFIPTHRSGQAVLQKSDAIVLKNQLKEVEEKLEGQGLTGLEIDRCLKPVRELIENSGFWSHQSDGLALYLRNGSFKKYTLPVKFEAFNYVANGFYLKPLMPMFTGDGRFFILTLELEEVKFYEATRHSIADVIIHDLTPARLEERVGYDYREKFLQFRTQQEGHGKASFHGHGEGQEDRKNEILRYFRAIDKGLMTMLHDEPAPMVVASQDFLFPIYREANTYQHLMDGHVSCNPSELDPVFLHERAWEIVRPWFDRERKEKVALFEQLHDTERTSTDIGEIVPAALDGKIDALFLQTRSDIMGVNDPASREVKIQEDMNPPAVSLMNLAAVKTFLQSGKVYLMEKEEMPASFSKVNALFRY